MSTHIRVVLADDHPAVRAGLRELLAITTNIEVTAALRPDLVVMDIQMPRLSGVVATRMIAAEWPDVRVLGLSAAAAPPYARAMREAGALGLLDKTTHGNVLLAMIRQLVVGGARTD